MSYHIDLDHLTVIHIDAAFEQHDMNAGGEPCATVDELRDFIRELHEQGAFDADARDELLEEAQV